MLKMLELLIDSKFKDSVIIELIQKHFDLRLSEAEDIIRIAKTEDCEKQTKK